MEGGDKRGLLVIVELIMLLKHIVLEDFRPLCRTSSRWTYGLDEVGGDVMTG